MMKRRFQRIDFTTWLLLIVMTVITSSALMSCGKEGNASPTGLNTQINIANMSPDVLPIDFYINSIKQNKTGSYKYGIPSGYIYLPELNTQLQLRTPGNLKLADTAITLRQNTRYTWFLTGLVGDNTLRSTFLTDTDAAPGLGKGKVRFFNALARSATLDVSANGTMVFKSTNIRSVPKYIEFPAGVYTFRLMQTGSTGVLTELTNFTVQDGHLYTLYARGIAGRAGTDTSAIAAGMITNR